MRVYACICMCSLSSNARGLPFAHRNEIDARSPSPLLSSPLLSSPLLSQIRSDRRSQGDGRDGEKQEEGDLPSLDFDLIQFVVGRRRKKKVTDVQ